MTAPTDASGDVATMATTSTRGGDGERAPDISEGTLLGRYVVGERIGAGAIGVVFAARDPGLDRRVAIKVLHARALGKGDAELRRARVLREAQALARLSHPAVVTVFDVGTHDERVWIAMELLDGCTLREWSKAAPRGWREVLRVGVEAGAGLAAAHDAGLVHCDFKPDNVMVDRAGHAKVVDFGLATLARELEPSDPSATNETRSTGADDRTRAGAVRGTPAYMSPEQHLGVAVDARADQFSFCVTLWEAIYGERPFGQDSLLATASAVLAGELRAPKDPRAAPSWLRRVLERGLAVGPEQRFADMHALLRELGRGQARARTRIALAVVAIAAVVIATVLLVPAIQRRRAELACAHEAASIAALWPGRAAATRAAVLATSSPDAAALADRLALALGDRAQRWQHIGEQLCHAAISDELRARAEACLDDRRIELEVLVESLGEDASALAQQSLVAATSLPAIEPCIDPVALGRRVVEHARSDPRGVELRRRLARLVALREVGAYAQGIAEARATVTEAELLGDPPATARARYELGSLLRANGDHDAAAVELEQAFLLADGAGDDLRAATAAIEIAGDLVTSFANPDEALVWTRRAEIALQRADATDGLLYARMLRVRGVAHRVLGELDTALRELAECIAITTREAGEEHPESASALVNLGNLQQELGRLDEGRATLARALELFERHYGPDHPQLVSPLNSLVAAEIALGHERVAEQLQRRTLAILDRSVGPRHASMPAALVNLASIQLQLGEHAEALATYRRALALYDEQLGPDHLTTATVWVGIANAEVALGHAAPSLAAVDRAVAIAEAAGQPGDNDLMIIHANAAQIDHKLGRFAEAKQHGELALAIAVRIMGPEHRTVAALHDIIGAALVGLGDLAGAQAKLRAALALRQRTSAPDDPALATTMIELGKNYVRQGQRAQAIELFERALAFDHQRMRPEVLAANRWWLALALWDEGSDRPRAVELARAAAVDYRGLGPSRADALAEVEAWLATHVVAP